MKSKRILYGILTIVLSLSLFPLTSTAATINEMKQQEENAKAVGNQINEEIDSVVDNINQKYKELAKLQEDVNRTEKVIKNTQQDVRMIEGSIDRRMELIASRMKDMQVKSLSQSSLQTILDSDNFSELISRFYAVTVLQNAEKSKVDSLFNDKEKLDELKKKLEATKASLEEKQDVVESEKEDLDKEVASLQKKLAANAEALQNLTSQRIAKENDLRREAEAKARKAAEEKAAREKAEAEAKNRVANQMNGSGKDAQAFEHSTVPPITSPAPMPSVPSGSSMPGSATAYIATGFNTATGTVPTVGRTIAVDPSVIPLGSRVIIEVPSNPRYSGVYTAEDTGGAINGTIVDIFVGSQSEAIQFGRRGIIITVLG